MGYLGLRVTLRPPSDEEKTPYKVGFGLLAILSVLLIIWQGIRNGESQTELQGNIGAAKRDAKAARDAAITARSDTDVMRLELNAENARRQQAERDFALIVRRAAADTRAGVATDIRKSPIQVQVNGMPSFPAKPLEAADFRLFQDNCVKEHDDAPYCLKLTIQSDKPEMRVMVAVYLSAEINYSRASNLPGAFVGTAVVYPSDKHIFVIAISALQPFPVISPEQSWVFYLSAESPIHVTSFEGAPPN
jgi:hypothetical protein